MKDTRSTPTADSMRADAEQITQAQDARTQQRKRKSIYNESTKNATIKYKRENRQRIAFEVRTGEREAIQAAAAAVGMSTNAYIIAAINEYTGNQIITPPGTADTYHTSRQR